MADLAPIILVPGLTGSRLQAVNHATGQVVDCWVPRICPSMWDTMAKYLWGFYSEEKARYVSWCEPEWSVEAVTGTTGVEWLSGQAVTRLPVISKQVSYFHELLCRFRKVGYTDDHNLVAFPYDWR